MHFYQPNPHCKKLIPVKQKLVYNYQEKSCTSFLGWFSMKDNVAVNSSTALWSYLVCSKSLKHILLFLCHWHWGQSSWHPWHSSSTHQSMAGSHFPLPFLWIHTEESSKPLVIVCYLVKPKRKNESSFIQTDVYKLVIFTLSVTFWSRN